LDSLKTLTDQILGEGRIFLMLFEDNSDSLLSVHSVNLSESAMNSFKFIEAEMGFFSSGYKLPETYRFADLEMEHQSSGIPDPIRLALQSDGLQFLYIFHLKNRFAHGSLVYCYKEALQMSTDRLGLCHVVNMHMNQLVEKIQFRKQFIKQKTYENLFNTLRVKDIHTVNHSYNVAFYSTLLGREAGLDHSELEQLKLGALLHDIGKITIPHSILLKPGRLTREEYSTIQQHPVMGYKLLEEYLELGPILPIVRWHHERMDGTGYPDRLSGGSIPFLARVVSLADAFDAMTSNRVYQISLTIDQVKEQLLLNAGTQFDQSLVHLLLRILKEQIKTTDSSNATSFKEGAL
jgi:putative nucleotidyltransferase with HDIG domain